MPRRTTVPTRVYKYRAFGDLALQTLVQDILYFADPSTFNDPLDAKPIFSRQGCVPGFAQLIVAHS